MKVIFLDIDGVLINDRSAMIGSDLPDQRCVERLNRLLSVTEAVLVISSMWRIGRSVPELQELMSIWGVKAKVVDRTVYNCNWSRGQEILDWLRRQLGVESFVILDDTADMNGLTPHLILTNSAVGLTDANVEEAIKRLAV